MWVYTIASLILLAGFITALAFASSRDNTFHFPFSSNVPSVLFHFILTTLFGFYNVFWEDAQLFSALTEPFVALGTEHKAAGASSNGRETNKIRNKAPNAHETLLLSYTCLPSIVAMYTAFSRNHWKVGRTAVMAMLQRALPIIVAGSFNVYGLGNASESAVEISRVYFIIIIIWLAVYLVMIPYEVLECGYSRHLPRNFMSIADLLSWTYSSSLFRVDTLNEKRSGGLIDDPLDIQFKREERDQGVKREQWHMEARLRLAENEFCFGLSKVPETGFYTMGICDSKEWEDVLIPPVPWPFRLWEKKKGSSGQDVETEKVKYPIAGTQKFNILSVGESFSAPGNNPPAVIAPSTVEEKNPPEG